MEERKGASPEGVRAKRAVAVYAALVAVAWVVAYLLRADDEGLSSAILLTALVPSVLLALPVVLNVTIENSVIASAILVAAGCLNAALLYRVVLWRTRTSEETPRSVPGAAP